MKLFNFRKLAMTMLGSVLKVKDVSGNNALKTFQNSLSKEDQDKPFFSLTEDQQFEYVRAMVNFKIEAMGHVGDASMKSLTMLALKMHKNDVNELGIAQLFKGSKDSVKEEIFSLTIKSMNSLPKLTEVSEVAGKGSKVPRIKLNPLWDDKEAVLSIANQMKDAMPEKSHKDLASMVASMLLTAEFMSSSNMETMDVGLDGLIDGDKDLNVSFFVEARRKEMDYQLAPSNPGYTQRRPM